jgi:hypothetical protein
MVELILDLFGSVLSSFQSRTVRNAVLGITDSAGLKWSTCVKPPALPDVADSGVF